MNTSLTGRVEGVGSSELPTWWTSHPLRTSLLNPYRPFAASMRRADPPGRFFLLPRSLAGPSPSSPLSIYLSSIYRRVVVAVTLSLNIRPCKTLLDAHGRGPNAADHGRACCRA